MEKIKDILTKDFKDIEIINLLIYLVILIMPYIVIKRYTPHYVVGKVIYLYVVGMMLFFILIRGKYLKGATKLVENKIIIIFFGALIIATFFGGTIKTSIVGNDERFEGLLMYGIYLLLFISAQKFIKMNKKLLNIILSVSSVMSIYSIFQFYGIDPVYKWLTGNEKVIGAFGFIGNRNFFGTYVLIFLTLSSILYVLKKEKIYMCYSIILFSALLVAQTRGTWIAFSIVILLIVIFFLKEKSILKTLGKLIVLFIVVFLVFDFTSKNIISSRGATIVKEISNLNSNDKNVKKNLGSGRGGIWAITIKTIMKEPIIGSGPDTLHYKIDKYHGKEYKKFIEENNYYVDKAHNEFLEYWACGGIVTLISYITLVIVILINLLKRIHENKAKILFLMISGYLIQSFFNISVIQVAPIYWILLGVAINYYRKDEILSSEY